MTLRVGKVPIAIGACYLLFLGCKNSGAGAPDASAPDAAAPDAAAPDADAGPRIVAVGSEASVSMGTAELAGNPSIAYNSSNDEYLVVWSHVPTGATDSDIFAQRLSAQGTLIGTNTPAIEPTASQDQAVVAYNSVENQYLIVCKTQDEPNFNGTRARVMASDLTPVADDFVLSTGQGDEPSVVYNPVLNEYLVTRRGLGIQANRVLGNGTPMDGPFEISASGAPNGEVALRSDGTYFGTWRQNQAALAPLAQRFTNAGELLGSVLIISDTSASSREPTITVAVDSVRERYLVVFGDFDGATIVGQFVTFGGELIGDSFVIADNFAEQPFYRAAYSAKTDAFLVVWNDRGDVIGSVLDGDGIVLAQAPLNTGNPTLGTLGIAVSEQEPQFAVVWPAFDQDGPRIAAQVIRVEDL